MSALLAKLGASILMLAAGVAQFALDYWWPDGRTRWNRRLKLLLLTAIILGAVVNGWVTFVEHREGERLTSQLEPMLVLAKERFPELDPDVALKRLRGRLQLPQLPLSALTCAFGGLEAPCSLFLDGFSLRFPEQVLGRSGLLRGEELSLDLPMQAYSGPEGVVLDVTVRDQGRAPLVTVRGRDYQVHQASLRTGRSADAFEVIGPDGIPIFPFHFDPTRRLLLIGGANSGLPSVSRCGRCQVD